MKHTKVWVVIGVIGFFAMITMTSVFSFREQAVKMEETVIAQYDQNRNNYDNMWKRFREMSQVTDRFAEDLKELYNNAMTGRYGENGSQAMFQWLKEQNPNLDPAVYTRLQSSIEAGRLSFAADQKQLIDKKRQYETLLRSNRAIFVNWILKFPKIDMDEYDIITSEATEEAFRDKKVDEVELF